MSIHDHIAENDAGAAREETVTTTVTTLGPVGLFFKKISDNPLTSIFTMGAVGGEGYAGYQYLEGRKADKPVETVQQAVSVLRAFFG